MTEFEWRLLKVIREWKAIDYAYLMWYFKGTTSTQMETALRNLAERGRIVCPDGKWMERERERER